MASASERNSAIESESCDSTLSEKMTESRLPDSHTSGAQDVAVDGELNGWKLGVVQFCLLFGLVLSVMDSSIVATALVDIGRYFDDFITLQWVVLSYLLTYLGFSLIFARISDILGRKWTTVAATLILTTMSLGCGLATTLNQLIAFRALQGIGGSGMFTMAMTTLPEITPMTKFGVMSALIGISFAVSAVLGPVIGGIITTHSTWRWCFLFNVPCGAFLILVVLLSWPKTKSAGMITWRQLDVVGCLFCLASTVLLIFALQEGGAGVYEWDSATIVSCFVVAGFSLVVFVLWTWFLSSKKRAIEPLVPGRVLVDRVLIVDIAIASLVGYIFYTVLIELPQRFQILNGKSSQTAGISLLPMSGASAVGSFLGGILSVKRNNTFYTLTASCALILLGSALLSTVSYSREIPHALYGFEAILGLGVGGTLSSATVIIKYNARHEDAASVQGLLGQGRILGGNIGLSIATLVLNQHFTTDLQSELSGTQIAGLKQSLNIIETFTPVQVEAVALSFAASFRRQLRICTYMAAAALVLCIFIWQRHPPSPASFAQRKNQSDSESENGQNSLEAQV